MPFFHFFLFHSFSILWVCVLPHLVFSEAFCFSENDIHAKAPFFSSSLSSNVTLPKHWSKFENDWSTEQLNYFLIQIARGSNLVFQFISRNYAEFVWRVLLVSAQRSRNKVTHVVNLFIVSYSVSFQVWQKQVNARHLNICESFVTVSKF